MTTISMYKISVPIFVQFLTSLSAVLDKAAEFAEAKKIEPSVLLNTRLAPDMFPLGRQVRAATDHAINACGRLAGAEMPSLPNSDATIPELKERIAKTIETGGRCEVQDSDQPAGHIHHETRWADGGRTDLADLIAICPWHHTRAHDPTYTMKKLPTGKYGFHRRT